MKSIVEKPWGSYQVLEEGTHYLLKKIIVNSGGKLSLQSHQHRSEHWIIAEGEAEVTINNDIKILILFCYKHILLLLYFRWYSI